MKRTRLNPKGPKTKQWERIRRQLKIWFENAEITFCEMCSSFLVGGFAHAKVRDYCTDNDLFIVALLCNTCHDKIETKDEKMEAIVLSIRHRNHVPELDLYLENYTYLAEMRRR